MRNFINSESTDKLLFKMAINTPCMRWYWKTWKSTENRLPPMITGLRI